MKRQKIMDIIKNINKPKKLDKTPPPPSKKKKMRVFTEFEIKKLQEIEDKRREMLAEISREDDVNKVSLLIDKLVKEGYPIQMVDVDENPTLAESAEVRGVPTTAIYENGNLVERIVGYNDADLIKRKIDVYYKK